MLNFKPLLNSSKLLCVTTATCFGLVSCDSNLNNSAVETAENRAPSLSPDELEVGDTLRLSPRFISDTNNAPTFPNNLLVLTGTETNVAEGDTFVYSQTGEFTFSLDLERDAENRTELAATSLFDDPSELGSDWRDLLFDRDGTDFTPEELEFIAESLSAGNAPVRVLPDGSGLFFEPDSLLFSK